MRSCGKRLLALLAVVCLLQFLCPLPAARASGQDRYGYSLLINEEQRTAYRKVAEGIGAYQTSIVFDLLSTNDRTLSNILVAIRMVESDYPEYFWFSGGANIQLSNKTVTVTPEAYQVGGKPANASQIAAAKKSFDAVIAQAKARIPAGASDYEKSEILHDFVDEKTQYRKTGDHQSAYGALVMGNAVCAGYTRAYQVLMQAVGIPCWYVSGSSYNPNGVLESHAWNLVWLDGKCCYTDVTWDDHTPINFHHYLNLSLEQISTDHFPDKIDIDGDGKGDGTFLPASCGHTAYTYFKQNAAAGTGICDMTGKETGDQIAKYFVLQSQDGDQAAYFCRVHYHGKDAFSQWISQNGLLLAGALKLSGSIQLRQEILGLEYQVTVTGTSTSTQPTEPQPTEPKPTEPKPTEPKPTEPKPTEPQPTEPKPTEPKPTDPKPTESQPTNPAPTESKPTNLQPTESVPQNTDAPASQPGQSFPTEGDPETQITQKQSSATQPGPSAATPTPENLAKPYLLYGVVGGGILIVILVAIGSGRKRKG